MKFDDETLKNTLFSTCIEWLEAKITIATKAVKDAQDSANAEEKSSAGDKYETGRAMSQNARDMYAHQLAECLRQKQLLNSIDVSNQSESIRMGSVVITNGTNYFISISAGKFEINNVIYFAVSPDTPIAKLILGKKKNDTFVFNNSTVLIINVF